MLPHWYKRGALCIEFTDVNVGLLLQKPAELPKLLRPKRAKPLLPKGAYWNSQRHSVYAWWCDGHAWHSRNRTVPRYECAEEVAQAARDLACELLEWVAANHAPLADGDNGEADNGGNDDAAGEA